MSYPEKVITTTSAHTSRETFTSDNFNSHELEKVESRIEKAEVHAPNYSDDPNNPMNWAPRKKMIILLGISANAFLSFFASAIYMPAVHDIMIYFKTSLTVINATIALFLVMNALAPLFWAPLSERIGRRWIYVISLLIFSISSLICGLSNNLGLFFTFRLIQAIGGGAAPAVGGGTISDMFDFKDRGKAMGIFMLGTIIGPSVAPVCGGYINQYLGWRWIFYIKAIVSFACAINSFFVVPETLYKPNEVDRPGPSNFKERLDRLKFNPFSSFLLLRLPENALACFQVSVGFGWFYFLVSIMSPTLAEVYGFSSGTIGLCFLAGGVGSILSTAFYGSTADKVSAYLIKRNNGVRVFEYRLVYIYVAVVFWITGLLIYGWLLHAKVHFMGPLVGVTLCNFGLITTITSTTTYMVELNNKKAASAVSLSNFTRSMFGMIFTLCAVRIRDTLGDGWSYTLAAIMSLVAYLGCTVVLQQYGPKWRKNREERAAAH